MRIFILLAAMLLALPAAELAQVSGTTFTRPLWVGTIPGQGSDLVVAEQGGLVLVVADDPAVDRPRVVLDLSERTRTNADGYSEEGLLALAFHPRFTDNGRLFAWWMPSKGSRKTVLSEFRCATSGAFAVDAASGREVLTVDQPFANHNGGDLRFGPDGMLYVSIGDGGGGGDPTGAGQRRDILLGKILRLDVDHGQSYRVPDDNPFVGKAGMRGEIWAWGLRNPWRMAFGPNGVLWCADVGQNAREEVDLIVKGGNYGWNRREGTIAFNAGAKDDTMIDPICDYGRSEGRSITGGEVYRGSAFPALSQRYVFGDWVSGTIWSVSAKGDRRLELTTATQPSSFGIDSRQELLLCDYRSGRILRLVP